MESGFFSDDEGRVVEIAGETEDDVLFHPQGGGFRSRMRKEDFNRIFKPFLFGGYAAISVSGDWLDEEISIPAYSDGRKWNGWAMPYFGEEVLERLSELMPGLVHNSNVDAYVMTDEEESSVEAAKSAKSTDELEAAEFEYFLPVVIEVEGRKIKTYPIGAGSWTWIE